MYYKQDLNMFPYVFPEKPLVNKMCNWKRPPDLKRNNVKVEIMQKKTNQSFKLN